MLNICLYPLATQSPVLANLMDKTFKNIVGNVENAGSQHFLPFPQCFPSNKRQNHLFTFFQRSPGFYVSAVQVLKTLREKKKLLITSNFSFSHSVFYLDGELSAIFLKFKIVVFKLFQFGRV